MALGDEVGADRAGSGSAIPVEAMLEDARSLSPEGFEARHGSAFLLLAATRLSAPGDSYSTDVQLLDDEDDDCADTGSLSILVFPVPSAARIATVGRASKNDVVIPDPSVSRVHALLKRGEDGVFLIRDAGSSNGTTVNGVSVLTRGHGPPTQLKPGDDVRLGRVEFTFVDAAGLRDFVLQSG